MQDTTLYPLRWWALAVVLCAEVMDLLDALITSIAGPSIVLDLGGGENLVQWLGAGYTVAMASGLLIGGRLGDRYGQRRLFLIGMTGFTLASLVCALSQSPEMIVTARIAQGALGALMMPQGFALMKRMFSDEELPKVFGLFGPVMGLSAVGGPILAGFLVDADVFGWGWRAVFAINIPLGIIALAAAARVLPRYAGDRTVRIELTSAGIAAASMFCLIFPLIQGQGYGWPMWTFALIAIGLAGFALLAKVEALRDRAGRPTLVTPTLFRKRAFTSGMVVGMVLFGSLMGMTIVFTFLVQFGLGFSPYKAGLVGIAQAVGMIVGFIASQPFNQQLGGRKTMQIGASVAMAGFVGFIWTLHLTGDAVGIWSMAPSLAAVGIGMGTVMAPFFGLVLAGVDEDEAGMASGVLTSIQPLGGAFGIAVLGTTFLHVLEHSDATTRIGAYRDASTWAMWVGAAFLLVTFALTFLLPERVREEQSALEEARH